MATVSRVQGTPDTRKGWANPVPPGLTDHPWKANPVKHPSELAVEKAESERRREEERRAQGDFRQQLRDAHTRRGEAQASLDHLVGLRGRANDLVRDLEARHQQLGDEVRAGNRLAAGQLVSALGQSMDDLPLSPGTDAAQAQLIELAGKLGVARDAVQQLSEEHRAAVSAVREAEAAVARCAVAVAIDHCVASAQEIEALSAELQARRSSLYSLTAAITSELRRLPHVAGLLYLPPICGRVLGAIDSKVDPVWSAKLKALHQDPEAGL